VDFPRKTYEVGEILPIKVAVLKGKKKIDVEPIAVQPPAPTLLI
ncbi:unnamed protein product, partial [marine sediment metagenome]